MNILPFDKTGASPSGETLLDGLAQVSPGGEATPGSFESVLIEASPLTGASAGLSDQTPDQADAPCCDATIVSASIATPTTRQVVREDSADTSDQEPVGDSGRQKLASDLSSTGDGSLAQFVGVPTLQAMMALALSSPAVVPVKTKKDGSSNASGSEISAVGAIGESTESTAITATDVQQFAKASLPSGPAAATKMGRSSSGSDAFLEAEEKGSKLSGQWEIPSSRAEASEISGLALGDRSPIAGGVAPQEFPGPVLQASNPLASEQVPEVIQAWPGASENSSEANSIEEFPNSETALQEEISGRRSAVVQGSIVGISQQRSSGPEIPRTELPLAESPLAKTDQFRPSNASGRLTVLASEPQGSRSDSPAANSESPLGDQTSGAKIVARRANTIPVIPAEAQPIASNTKSGKRQAETVEPNNVASLLPESSISAEHGSNESVGGSVNLLKPSAEAEIEAGFVESASSDGAPAAKNATEPVNLTATVSGKPGLSQNQEPRTRRMHVASLPAVLGGQGRWVKGLPLDGSEMSESVKPQIPQTARPDVPALRLPAQPVPVRLASIGTTIVEADPVVGVREPSPSLISFPAQVRRAVYSGLTRESETAQQSDPASKASVSEGVLKSELMANTSAVTEARASDQAEVIQTSDRTTAGETRTPQPNAGGDASSNQEKTTKDEPKAELSSLAKGVPSVESTKLVAQIEAKTIRSDAVRSNADSKLPVLRVPGLNRSVDRSGIGDAQHDEHMVWTKNNEPGPELAGKNMPNSGKNDFPSRNPGQVLAANELNRARVDSSGDRMADLAFSSNAWLDNAERARSLDEPIGSLRADGHLHARLTERIWSAIETFRSSGSDNWIVRIRPDHDVELNLRLKVQENQLVIHARLESGNWDALAPNWRDLQAQLANRGIQLQPLEGSGDRSALSQNFNPMNSDPQNQRQHHAGEDGSRFQDLRELDFRFASEVAERKKPRAAAKTNNPGKGWESWA